MNVTRCSALRENCAAHAALVAKLDGWVTRLETEGPSTALVLEVHRECSTWLQSHIVRIDCKLRDCGKHK